MYEELQTDLGLMDTKECRMSNKDITESKPQCPECGEPLIFEGGCNICKSCGWSKCD